MLKRISKSVFVYILISAFLFGTLQGLCTPVRAVDRSPDVEIILDGSTYNANAEFYQRCLNYKGYTDDSGNRLDEDGYFGSKSMEALNKYLKAYNFGYFSSAAAGKLYQEAKSQGGFPDDEKKFNGSVYDEEAKYYQYCLRKLGYTKDDGSQIDADGYFGSQSYEALNKFLTARGFKYFSLKAAESLMQDAGKLVMDYETNFTTGSMEPAPIAFAYGNLTNIHNLDDPFHSMAVLSSLPYAICSEPEHLSFTEKKVTEYIKSHNAKTKIFGYVNIGVDDPYVKNPVMSDIDEVKEEIDNIKAAGWYGVFIDQFGYGGTEYGECETRERQNAVIAYAHDSGLVCMANSWFPEEAVDAAVDPDHNPYGTPAELRAGDWLLIESFLVDGTDYRGNNGYLEKYLKYKEYEETKGINVLALSYKMEDDAWAEASQDIQLSYILAQCLNLKGWWFGGAENDKFLYGTDPDIDIGSEFVQYLQHDSGIKYVAKTDKYIIEYYADIMPYMFLKPLSGTGRTIQIGQIPSSDYVSAYSLESSEVKRLQQSLNAFGFKDGDGSLLDEDGVLGSHTLDALNNYLKANGYTYFCTAAKENLVSQPKAGRY